jgi:hypothetical protein
MGTANLSLGYGGRNVALNTHPPSSAEFKEREQLYLYLPICAFKGCYRVDFTFTFYTIGWTFCQEKKRAGNMVLTGEREGERFVVYCCRTAAF